MGTGKVTSYLSATRRDVDGGSDVVRHLADLGRRRQHSGETKNETATRRDSEAVQELRWATVLHGKLGKSWGSKRDYLCTFFAPYRVINLFILKLKPDSQDFSRRGEGEMVRMQIEAGTRWNTILVTLLTMIFHFLPRPQSPPPSHLMCRKFPQINSTVSLSLSVGPTA